MTKTWLSVVRGKTAVVCLQVMGRSGACCGSRRRKCVTGSGGFRCNAGDAWQRHTTGRSWSLDSVCSLDRGNCDEKLARAPLARGRDTAIGRDWLTSTSTHAPGSAEPLPLRLNRQAFSRSGRPGDGSSMPLRGTGRRLVTQHTQHTTAHHC